MYQPPPYGPPPGPPYGGPGYPPPPGPGYPPNPYAPPGGYYGGPPPMEENSNAKLAMILAFCGLVCGICAPIALVIGLNAQSELRASPGRYHNGGQATVGVVVGGILTGLMVIGILTTFVFR